MFIASVANNGGINSGVKATREGAESWAKNQLETSKHTRFLVFEAVACMEVAPREIVTTELKPTEENTRPETTQDVKCEACDPEPPKPSGLPWLRKKVEPNGHDGTSDSYFD